MLPLIYYVFRLAISSFYIVISYIVLGVYPVAGRVFIRLSNISVPIVVKVLLRGSFSLLAIIEEEAILYYYSLYNKSVRCLWARDFDYYYRESLLPPKRV